MDCPSRPQDEIWMSGPELAAHFQEWETGLSTRSEEQEKSHFILTKTLEDLSVSTAVLFRRNEATDRLEVVCCEGEYLRYFEGLSIRVGEGISGWAVAHARPPINGPAMGDLAQKVKGKTPLELKSSLSMPLNREGKIIGALTLYHVEDAAFTAGFHQAYLERMASLASECL